MGVAFWLGACLHRFSVWFKGLGNLYVLCYTGGKVSTFRSAPRNARDVGVIFPPCVVVGGSYISVGKKVSIGRHSAITAWDRANGDRFSPEIIFEDGCTIGQFAHITAINRIHLGKGVLLGKNVTITDNSHGRVEEADKLVPPTERGLFSKGPVEIGDRVWIGDKATILPGVTIGEGAVIGANAVVSKSVPAYAVVVGNPMRIVKYI